MKKLIIFIFLIACTTQTQNNETKVNNLKFDIDFTFDEYKNFLTKFNANSIYPDISK